VLISDLAGRIFPPKIAQTACGFPEPLPGHARLSATPAGAVLPKFVFVLTMEDAMARILVCLAAVMGFAAAPAMAETLVTIKAGEWVRTMDVAGGHSAQNSPPYKVCYKQDRVLTDADLNQPMVNGGECTNEMKHTGNVVTFKTVCSADKVKTTTNSTMTIVSDDDFTITTLSHMEHGKAATPADTKMSMHYLHTGPCQADDRPAAEEASAAPEETK
jgi:hypothetical protein